MKTLAFILLLQLGGSFETHLAYLASDALEGRAPGTRGGDLAARYVLDRFDDAGLSPYFQPVPLIGRTSLPEQESLVLVVDGTERVVPRAAFALASETTEAALDVSGRVVSADDDFSGAFVAVEDETHAELARAHSAAGALYAVDELPDTSFEHLSAGWSHERALAMSVWIDAAELHQAGSVELRVRHRADVRRFTAPNVVAVLEGRVPDSEAIVVTAHYDAYGVGASDASGDNIYNGAIDNASGVAALIELARHFAERPDGLDRTLVFVATTAEERGTLGARFYVDHPVVPLERTAVVINVDGINTFAPTDDFIVFPSVGTDTAEALAAIGDRAEMSLSSESWQAGMHFAFDTAPFLKRGRVGLTLWQGSSYKNVPPEELERHFRRLRRTHTPQDEWSGGANADAIEQHLRLYVAAINHYGRATTPPPHLLPDHPFGAASPF